MTEYALSTNLYTYAQVHAPGGGFFGWPAGSGEGESIRQLSAGDLIVPKFAAMAAWSETDNNLEWQRSYCAAIGVDYNKVRQEYEAEIDGGNSGVPFLLRVAGDLPDDERQGGEPWARVRVEKVPLDHSLSSKEFLLLRAVPTTIAAQFKGTVAPGRHLQELPDGTAVAIQTAARAPNRAGLLRQYTLVRANSAVAAAEAMNSAGRALLPGDRVFIASPGGLLGVHDVTGAKALQPVAKPIQKSPDELLELFEEAKQKARKEDQFTPARAIAAASELKELLASPAPVVPIDDFGRFHDRYLLLASKVTQAMEIANRPSPPVGSDPGEVPDGPEPQDSEVDELAALQGLTIDAVRRHLPPNMVLPDSVLAEAVTALRAGKHLLLGGPPGTGKSTLAEALCRAVLGSQYDVVTATADWTTFDTIGGYMPVPGGGLRFEPGIVLRCLQKGRWLTIDELNRADIDKAFGPLFTMLAGAGGDQPNRRTVLPFQSMAGKNVEIRWAEKRTGTPGDFVITPGWRLIGTLNLSDKATLFQLSFAFLRRFAVLDVPLPPRDEYAAFFRDLCTELSDTSRENVVAAAMSLAYGPRQIGPAILKDVAAFLTKGLAPTASGHANYDDDVQAFVTAVRLFAVPQYEGATSTEVAGVLKIFKEVWPGRSVAEWDTLAEALNSVALS